MGLVTEGEPQNQISVNSKERDLISILTSEGSLDELNRFAKPHNLHLSQDEYDRLIRQLGSSDKDIHRQASLELTWYCLPTVNVVVQKYRNMGISDADILQQSLLTIKETIFEDLRQPQPEVDLKQRVHRKVGQEIELQLTEIYKIKHRDIDLLFIYFDARKLFLDEVGREASEKELSQLFEIIRENNSNVFPDDTTRDSSEINHHNHKTLANIHNNHIAQDQGTKLLDSVVDNKSTEETGEENIFREELRQITEGVLTEKEQRILKLRYEDELTVENAGKAFGVTRERARQIEATALSRLRHPNIRRHLRPHLDNVPRGTTKTTLLIAEETEPVDLKEPKVRRHFAEKYEAAGGSSKPLSEKPKETQEVEIEKSELPKDYWLDYHFRRYITGTTLGKEELLSSGNYPENIEVGSVWHETLNSIRNSALRSERQWAFAGCGKEKDRIRLITGNLQMNPELMEAPELLQLMNDAFEKEKLISKVGDVQTILRYRPLFTLLGITRYFQVNHEQPSLSPTHLYRFLTDKDRPILTAKVDGENNIFVFRTLDTINLDPNDRYITQGVFTNHWYNSFGYERNAPGLWMPRHLNGWKGWLITKEIAKSHNLALYISRPDKPLTKV